MKKYLDFSILKGKTITKVETDKYDYIKFWCSDGTKYGMSHEQDCCESVSIEDIDGDLNDLVGGVVVDAYQSSEEGDTDWGTSTWTFYRITGGKGTIVIRWFGESNGYYSEGVDFYEL